MDTLGKPEMTRFEKKIPYVAEECQRCSASSPLHVVAMPVGPTGGERPQARASRGWHPSHARPNVGRGAPDPGGDEGGGGEEKSRRAHPPAVLRESSARSSPPSCTSPGRAKRSWRCSSTAPLARRWP